MILKDRIAIATAAGSGIGRAGAEIMAREGATVVVADLRADAGRETAEAIVANGGQAMSVPTDVTDPAQLKALVTKTMQEYGRIDILHSHAAWWYPT
jgi:NAD(P)-dependent dehydrogenase (short-subunit alcohol dehydrogenase family)